MKMPEIAATKTVMTALEATIAVLVIIGVVGAVSVSPSSSKKTSAAVSSAKTTANGAPVNNKNPALVDACSLVTAPEATAAFGGDAGAAHTLLGACLYDNGTHKLIVALTHENAKSQFDAARGTAAKDVAGIGDSAYVLDGRLRILKGSFLLMITLVPAEPVGASPALVTLGKAAAPRL